MAKSIVFVPPVSALESRIAWRSEPGPLSAVVVTTKTPSVISEIAAWIGIAPADSASSVSVVLAVEPRRRREGQARQRRRRAPRAGRCTTAIRSHRPSRSGRRCSTGSASRSRPRASGPTSGRAARHPGPAARCHRPTRPRRPAADREHRERTASAPGGWPVAAAETSEVLPCGVGGRGRDDRQPGRRRERDGEDGPVPGVGRHLQRAEVVLGLARAAGTVAGAGEDVDAEGRVGRAAAQPALELAVGRRDDDREVLKVVRSLARCSGVVGDPVVAQVDGLAAAVRPRWEDRRSTPPACRRCGWRSGRGRSDPGLRRRDSRPPGPARCRRGAVLMSWLISPADRATLQTRTSSIWPTKPYQPSAVAGQSVRVSGPDLVEAVRDVLRAIPTRTRRAGHPGRGSSSRPHRRRRGRRCATRPSLTVPLDVSSSRSSQRCITRPAVELAVGADIERREPIR